MSELPVPSEPEASRNMFEPDYGPNPSTSDDSAWWAFTGSCGGCGNSGCHEGICTERAVRDLFYGYRRLLCDRCPDRKAEGWWTQK